MKSTERCFLVSSEMWLQQMQCWHQRLTHCDNPLCLHSQLHFDLFWKKKKKRRQGGSGEWHCAHDHTQDNVCQQQQQCHYVRETKTDNRGWFHGALTLHVQSSKDYHTSRRDPSSIGFNLFVFYPEAELWPLYTTEAKFILFKWKFNFFPPFQLYLYIWHPVRQAESTACWLMELLALSSSRGWSEGVSVSR